MVSNFPSTPTELALVSRIFAHADPQKLGALTGDVAVKVFAGANLPSSVLGEIWNIADEDNKGWLSKRGVAIAVRLIGHAQNGEKVSVELLNTPGPLPKIDGIAPISQQNTGISLPKSPPPGFPPLTPQDKTKFFNLFHKSGPVNGLLSGEKAREIFVKSKLPNDRLLQIWNLADTHDRGALDPTDFAIGMYFIQGLMSGQITFVPPNLPPGLYQQAGGTAGGPGEVTAHLTGATGPFSPMASSFQQRSQLQPQTTGQPLQPDYTGRSVQSRAPTLPARPNIPSAVGTSAFSNKSPIPNPAWDVTPADKINSDRFFDTLDQQRRGYIEGEVAVPFMLESKLPGEVLAQIWDLADINNDGHLTRDGFAVAMYLIQKKLSGNEIPATLPPSLIPPSMRAANGATSSSAAPPQEPARDLFSFDDSPPPSATLPQPGRFMQAQHTGGPGSAFPTVASPANAQDPFGSSSFNNSGHHDLLGDDDTQGTSSPPLQDQSAEIGNLKNQINSTNRSLDNVKTERVALENNLSEQAAQLSGLQTQLSSAKAAYETETKLLAALKERFSNQTNEIQSAREQLIRAESELSGVRVEKAEIEGSFLRDKEEARDLHKRMIEVGQEAEALKAEIEKAKKDAKQQKGLLAIARKQLSTKEADRAKAQAELEAANGEVESLTKEREDVGSDLLAIDNAPPLSQTFPHPPVSSDSLGFAASQPLPSTPDLSSPLSVSPASKSKNPFERLAMASDSFFLPNAGASRSVSPTSAPVNGAASVSSLTASDGVGSGIKSTAGEASDTSVKDDLTIESEDNLHVAVNAPTASSTTQSVPGETVLSADTEYFVTPPQTASMLSTPAPPPTSLDANDDFFALDQAAAHFPPVAAISSEESTAPTKEHNAHVETDLNSSLKELDIEEQDSDSDDEIPLAELASSTMKESNGNHVPATSSTVPSFDDVFGESSSLPPPLAVPEPKPEETLVKPFSPFDTLSTPFGATSPSAPVAGTSGNAAGVNAFDEAMGTIPSASPAAKQLGFESAFDDNFDFAAASQSVNNTSAPEAPLRKEPEKVLSVDSFPSVTTRNKTEAFTPVTTLMSKDEALSSSKNGPSFEEAFASFDAGPTLNLENSFAPSADTRSPSSPVRIETPSKKTIPSGPSTPTQTPSTRSFSPPVRGMSPPPRNASPKQRASSSSFKETHHEKVKEPTTRHSKLSIRLPFGKKKKTQDAVPLPTSQHLAPPKEEPSMDRAVSPAVDDDVEAVKQLTAMGFSRSQAVDALEKYGYDVQKALNSLLGAA